MKTPIPSVNYHLWQPCNMRCSYCFATFQDVVTNVLPKGHLTKDESLAIISKLAEFGFKKITFAGGEPTLCPWLDLLIGHARDLGMTTMVVSNGSLILKFFHKYTNFPDWVAISIDSLNPNTNQLIGRSVQGKKPLDKQNYLEIINFLKNLKIRIKINTVVSAYNWQEDMNEFIKTVQPERWKVLQVLKIEGQNESLVDSWKISDIQFKSYANRHNLSSTIFETNDDIIDSYVMIDPAGRFFGNSGNKHSYSEPILDIGVQKAFPQMPYSKIKFEERNGIYDWGKVE